MASTGTTSTHTRRQPRLVRTIAVGASLLAGVSVLAACGGGGSSGKSKSTGSSTSASSGSGKTFVAAIPALPPTLDPTAFSGGTRPYMAFLDSFLFNFQSTACGTGLSANKLVGDLAKSWKASPDGKSYDIVLNNETSGYGHKLTSADVKWSVDFALANSPIPKYLSSADAHFAANPITIVSPTEFKLNVKSMTPDDLALFAIPTFAIFDSTEAKAHATAADKWGKKWLATNSPVFGPWKVSSFSTGNQITLAANPGYTGTRGNISKVIIKQVAGASDQSQLLQSGSIDYAGSLTWSQYKSLQTNSKVKVYACAPVSRDLLIVNYSDKALGNVKVRKAISMALDRDQLNTGAYSGLGTPATTGLLPAEMPADSGSVPAYTHDVAAAKQLLTSAGYPNGFTMTLGYNENQPGSQVDQSSILIQSQLKQIGITVNLNHVANGNDFNQAFQTGKYQAVLYYTGAALPSTYFDVSLAAPGSPNDSWGFKDPTYAHLVQQVGTAAVGSSTANVALTKIANYMVTQLPWIPLVNTPNIFAMSAKASGVDGAVGPIVPQTAAITIQ